MKIMERTYICANGVREKTRYAVPDRARPRGKRTKGKTSQRKQEQNFKTGRAHSRLCLFLQGEKNK